MQKTFKVVTKMLLWFMFKPTPKCVTHTNLRVLYNDQIRLRVGLPLDQLLQYHCTYETIKSPYDNIQFYIQFSVIKSWTKFNKSNTFLTQPQRLIGRPKVSGQFIFNKQYTKYII